MCPNLMLKGHTLLRTSHPLHPFWPSWWGLLLVSLWELCFVMLSLESDWDQQPFSQKPLNKNELLNLNYFSVFFKQRWVMFALVPQSGMIIIPWQFPELWLCLSLNHWDTILSPIRNCSFQYLYSCSVIVQWQCSKDWCFCLKDFPLLFYLKSK